MDWKQIQEKLEHVLGTSVIIESLPQSIWNSMDPPQSHEQSHTLKRSHDLMYVYFRVSKNSGEVKSFKIMNNEMNVKEIDLIEFIIDSSIHQGNSQDRSLTIELGTSHRQLRDWLIHRIEEGIIDVDIPIHIVREQHLHASRIPILLQGEFFENQVVTHQDFKKLLDSFFGDDVIVISLNRHEWLILVGEQILIYDHDDQYLEDDREPVEPKLEAIAAGLQEMLWSEWFGECHLAIHYPIRPDKQVVSTAKLLRETLKVGSYFHPDEYIHRSWSNHLEKLLYALPEMDKTQFIHQVLKTQEMDWDDEIRITIEHFVTTNCHVSHTAKKLYIHRNTLLYRLDKFKQMTGRDVRNFEDAVLVRIALLLDKLTKSK